MHFDSERLSRHITRWAIAALLLILSTPASAGIGDPFNGIDISLIDKSTGSAGLMLPIADAPVSGNTGPGVFGPPGELTIPAGIIMGGGFGNTSNDIEDDQFIANFEYTISNLSGTFANGGGAAGGYGGSLNLAGTWRAKAAGGLTLFELPLSAIGATGTAMAATFLGGTVTITGAGWTTGIVTIGGVETPLGGTTVVQATGTDLRTPGGFGMLQLVTPVRITTPNGTMGMLLGLNLTVVPEPGSTSLIAAGLVGLAFLRGERRRADVQR